MYVRNVRSLIFVKMFCIFSCTSFHDMGKSKIHTFECFINLQFCPTIELICTCTESYRFVNWCCSWCTARPLTSNNTSSRYFFFFFLFLHLGWRNVWLHSVLSKLAGKVVILFYVMNFAPRLSQLKTVQISFR